MPFQPAGGLSLDGDVIPIVVHEPGQAPTNIIRAGTPFHVHVQFHIFGTAVPMIAGTFHVQVFFESYGPGTEAPAGAAINVPVTSVPLQPSGPHGPNERQYNVFVNVAGGLLSPALYEMISVVTYSDVTGAPGNIAGYSEEQVIQVFPG